MHARPEVKQILISHKLRRWASIGRCPTAYPNCSPSRARRNYSRLCTARRTRPPSGLDFGFGIPATLDRQET